MTGPRNRAAIALATALFVMTAAAPMASAEPLAVRTTGLVHKDGKLYASVGLQDLFQPEHRARLKSGFATRVLIRSSLSSLRWWRAC